MADSTTQRCECLYGTAWIDPVTGTCTCLPVDTTTGGIKQPPVTIQTVKPGNIPAQSIFNLTAITDWIKAHPFIVAGGAAFVLYLLFFRGRSRRR